jgi:hypothetical protein
MSSTQIATIFLDRELRIQRYTPPAVALFNLIPTDLGRPLSDLRHRLEYDSFAADAKRVLDQLTPLEREAPPAPTAAGTWRGCCLTAPPKRSWYFCSCSCSGEMLSAFAHGNVRFPPGLRG